MHAMPSLIWSLFSFGPWGFCLFVCLFAVLEMEAGVLHILGKYPTTELLFGCYGKIQAGNNGSWETDKVAVEKVQKERQA
jgi:hypothetical protein